MNYITIFIDKRRALGDGTYPIKIRVTKIREFYVSTKISVKLNQWDGVNVVNHPQSAVYTDIIRAKRIEVEAILLDLDKKGELDKMDYKQIQKVVNSSLGRAKPNAAPATFIAHFKKFADSRTADKTKNSYALTLHHINEFRTSGNLSWEDVNFGWLSDFGQYLAGRGNKTNTIAIHMRNIRSVFNDAINREITLLYPFRKFKIKTERTAKRSLSVDELRALRDYPCQEYQERYRDIFMLIFYFIGINMVDLVNLTGIEKGRVEFKRAKTGRLYSIKVEPEAKDIIKKYKGKKHLLNIIENYVSYDNFLKLTNKELKKIGKLEMIPNASQIPENVKNNKKKIEPLFPNISTYWARHTWATIAAGLDIPKETIAAALGHGGNDVTDIYIKFDEKKIDAANRKVINFLGKVEVVVPEKNDCEATN